MVVERREYTSSQVEVDAVLYPDRWMTVLAYYAAFKTAENFSMPF